MKKVKGKNPTKSKHKTSSYYENIYNPPIADVEGQVLIQPFTPVSLTGSLIGTSVPGIIDSVDVQAGRTANIYRTKVENVPEPSTLLLGEGALAMCGCVVNVENKAFCSNIG